MTIEECEEIIGRKPKIHEIITDPRVIEKVKSSCRIAQIENIVGISFDELERCFWRVIDSQPILTSGGVTGKFTVKNNA